MSVVSAPLPLAASSGLLREARLLWLRRAGVSAVVGLLIVAAVATVLGVAERERQLAAIEEIRAVDTLERAEALAKTSDWGGAAYAAFHATWDAPAPLAFAAFGQRDVRPWVLRIRALALEGQIYETDVANPELARTGRLDLAFVAAFLAPLVLLLLLHDLVAGEREAGREGLLLTSAVRERRLWAPRIGVRVLAVFLALALPFLGGALVSGAGLVETLLGLIALGGAVLLWSVPLVWLAFRARSAAVIATQGLLLWVVLALVLPAAARLVIDAQVDAVEGADVSMLQREAVNDAWDLPKAATMEPFYASHPEWSDSAPVEAWHWKWYYAFQQVGDEKAAPLVADYRAALVARDRLAGWVAFASPSIAVQRWLQRLAETDTTATLAYEDRIRAFHEQIRTFYYPMLFRDAPFDATRFDGLPTYEALTTR